MADNKDLATEGEKEQLKGAAKQVEGKAQEIKGKVQQGIGKAKQRSDPEPGVDGE
jgi:uncharacterized protein YjbJ (UPF0337 family)